MMLIVLVCRDRFACTCRSGQLEATRRTRFKSGVPSFWARAATAGFAVQQSREGRGGNGCARHEC
jgi:hypothetical protein